MKTYVVKQGDHIAKIAVRNGTTADAIWAMPENKDLAALRSQHILAPGDIVRLPDAPAARQTVTASGSNDYAAAVPTVPLDVTFTHVGEALADEAFEVHGVAALGGGTTDGSGHATIDVPADLDQVAVRFRDGELEFRLQVGCLDPIDTPRGAEQRLAALRYLYLNADTPAALRTRRRQRATRLFQSAEGLATTGELDADTLSRLGERAGF